MKSADEIFETYFQPSMTREQFSTRPFRGLYPDTFQTQTDQEHLIQDVEWRLRVQHKKNELSRAAANDFSSVFGVDQPQLDADTIDNVISNMHVESVIQRSPAAEADCEYLLLVCEIGSVIGDIITRAVPSAQWFLSWPIWDSCVREERADMFFPVYHWSIRRLSSDWELLSPKVDFAIGKEIG